MLHDSIDAFVEQNPRSARDICKRDDHVDKLNDELIQEVMDVMKRRPELIEPAMHLFSVIRHVERVADHATNMLKTWCILSKVRLFVTLDFLVMPAVAGVPRFLNVCQYAKTNHPCD